MKSGFGIALFLMALVLSPVEAWEPVALRASGVGYAPAHLAGTARGRLMAERAATVVAARNLARHLYGIPPTDGFAAYVPPVRTIGVRPLYGYGVEAVVETELPLWRIRSREIQW
ncbi:MAG: hypothetical protein AB1696_20675 [Planctomycetota bacterium]